MDLNTIKSELEKLSIIISGWNHESDVTALERDLALEKLRMLYEEIRFGAFCEPFQTPSVPVAGDDAFSMEVCEVPAADWRTQSVPAAMEPVPVPAEPTPCTETPEPVVTAPVEEPAPVPEPVAEPTPVSAGEKPSLDLTSVLSLELDGASDAEEDEEEYDASVPELEEVELSVAPQEETVAEAEPAVPQTESEEAPMPVVEMEELVEESVETSEEDLDAEPVEEPVRESALSSELPAPSSDADSHRHRQQVIMSLYDAAESDGEPEIEQVEWGKPHEAELPDAEAESDVPEEEEDPFEVIPIDQHALEQTRSSSEEHPRSENHRTVLEIMEQEAQAAAGSVLGEVIKPQVQTLADTIAPRKDIASEILRTEPLDDLRTAIGINDKFLLIRDLFQGDVAAYDRAVEVFNGCESLDDCMIYIAEHFAWNSNSDGAKLMMELLERKFSVN